MNKELEQHLSECLDAMERGESLAAILQRYPQQADQLRPFLEVAAQLQTLHLQPSLEAQARSRQTFLAEADRLRGQKTRPAWPRWALRAAASLLMLLLVSLALLPISAGAMPGSPLYGVKRLAETARLTVTSDLEGRLELAEAAKQARRDEVAWVLVNGRSVNNLSFEGPITRFNGTAWQIAGIPIQLDEQTQVEGQPEVGALAIVSGRARQGIFIATAISISSPPAPPPPAPVEATPAPATPAATPSVTPSPTQPPAASPTPSPTPAPTESGLPPVSSPAPPVSPTETAVSPIQPPGDDNDNGDDRDNNDNNDNNDNGDDHDDDDDNDND